MIQPYMNSLPWAIRNNYVACLPIRCVNQTNIPFFPIDYYSFDLKSSIIFIEDYIQKQ